MAIHLIGYTLEWKPAGSWLTIPAGAVEDFDGSSESAQADIGVGFGDTAYTRATFKVLRSALLGNATARKPIRLTPSVDAVAKKAFVGVIVRSSGVEVVTLECIGILQDLSRRLKDTYSPLFELRPIATKTTASSIEDPTDPDYAGGIFNYASASRSCWFRRRPSPLRTRSARPPAAWGSMARSMSRSRPSS
jgi:hypothetical protein